MECPYAAAHAASTATTAATPADGVGVYDVDFYADATIVDQFAHFARMRELGPVVWLPAQGNYAITRYAELRAALHDWQTFSAAQGVAGDDFGCEFTGTNTLASDPPLHDKLRKVSSAPLRPSALTQHHAAIQQAADALIDDLVARGDFDGVDDFARHLPTTLVTEFVGLPDEGRENMLTWANAAFNILGTQNERGRASVEIVKKRAAWLEDNLRSEVLRPGSWTRQLHELGAAGEIPAEWVTMIQRDYISPSLDTTISATASLILLLGQNPHVWDEVRANPDLIPGAVSEAVRLGSPVRSFTRTLTTDHTIGDVTLPAGARVMMLYGSANHDERQFPHPERFDPRRPLGEHLGFGSGVHMCEGMHLAQLEMQALLRAMVARVATIEVGEPQVALNNTIYGLASLPVRFTPLSADDRDAAPHLADGRLEVRVVERHAAADGVASLLLEATRGTLPAYTAGSHVDVELPSGLMRQYSLCSSPAQDGRYRLGVLLDPRSRGGSLGVHAELFAGSTFVVSRPRNLFALDPDAPRSLLLAGGIGITPILAMAYELQREGRDFALHYTARSASRVAFRDEITTAFGGAAHLYADDAAELPRLDLAAVLADADPDAHLYICGPGGFIDFVVARAREVGWAEEQLHVESFTAPVLHDTAPFEVTAARSGVDLTVAADQTLLQALLDAGVDVPYSCESGICGTCVTPVAEGEPEHHDQFLSDAEKSANTCMAVCVSRSHSPRLVLDV